MLHPSYSDLMEVVNSEVEEGETPVVNSRYSIVMATSKRARQIVAGAEPLVEGSEKRKALSYAIEELQTGKVKIVGGEEEPEEIEMTELIEDIIDEPEIEEIEEVIE